MNFINNSFPQDKFLSIESFKLSRVAISAIGKIGAVKFHDLNCSFLFDDQEWQYFRNQLRQSKRRYRPNGRRFLESFSGDKSNVSPKSLYKKLKDRNSGIANFKSNSKDVIRFILGLPLLNAEAALRINNSSKVWIIKRFCLYGIYTIKRVYFLLGNKVFHMLFLSNMIHKFIPVLNNIVT